MARPWRSIAVASAALLAACGEATGPIVTTSVVALQPNGGATGVDPGAPLVITFSHPMQAGMEAYVALHEGDVSGPLVPGSAVWSADFMVLTFTPSASLKSATRYTLHLGGGMRDARGWPLDYTGCLGDHGASWVTQDMMGGGGMGSGWRHHNGTYGVVLSFTTA